MEKYFIVVPCYNEEEVLPETMRRLRAKLVSLMDRGFAAPTSRILFIDDGSADRTWEMIKQAHEAYPTVFTGLSLDRNRGHQTALTEGLMAARAERAVAISIDADLQDDVNAIDAMCEKREEGAHIVCGVRASRQTDTFMKRFTARSYYRLMRFFGSDLIYDHADFRLMGPEALDKLALYHGDDLFLRGLITRLGYKCETVSYDRAERFAGESKYTLKKMLKLAFDGIIGFSDRPLTLIGWLGGAIAGLSLLGLIALIVCAATVGCAPWLWAVCGLALLNGIVMIALGVQGAYMNRIYDEAKGRPLYILAESINLEKEREAQ